MSKVFFQIIPKDRYFSAPISKGERITMILRNIFKISYISLRDSSQVYHRKLRYCQEMVTTLRQY